MTKNLTINITGMTTDDLLIALVEVQKKVEQEYLSGADRNSNSNYIFEVYSSRESVDMLSEFMEIGEDEAFTNCAVMSYGI